MQCDMDRRSGFLKKALKNELKHAFDTPPPARRDEFLDRLEYPRAGRVDLVISQMGYIRKRFWVLSVLLFAGTLASLYFCGAPASLVWILSSTLPFISLAGISEIARSATYKMEELEMSCKYNLLEISLVRLGILGAANFILLGGILFMLSGKTSFGLVRLGLYLFTPYLLTCYGTLFAVNRLKSRETMYVCGGVTGFVSIMNALLRMQVRDVYAENYLLFWAAAFIAFVALSAKETAKLISETEELGWNSSLTG